MCFETNIKAAILVSIPNGLAQVSTFGLPRFSKIGDYPCHFENPVIRTVGQAEPNRGPFEQKIRSISKPAMGLDLVDPHRIIGVVALF